MLKKTLQKYLNLGNLVLSLVLLSGAYITYFPVSEQVNKGYREEKETQEIIKDFEKFLQTIGPYAPSWKKKYPLRINPYELYAPWSPWEMDTEFIGVEEPLPRAA